MSRRGVARCSLAAVLFGTSTPFAAQLAGDMNAFTLAGLLYLGAAVAVVPLVGRALPNRVSMRAGGRRLLSAVVLGGAVGPALLAGGLSRVPASTSSLLLNLELVFTAILAVALFKEHLGSRLVIGTTLVVVAGVTLGWSGDPELRWGAILIVGACACWGVDNCVTASLDELTPAQITLVKGTIAGGANLALGLALGGSPAAGPTLGALVIGAFGYGISITLWVAGARDLGAARGQLVFASAPFVGAVVAWTVLGDQLTGREAVSLLLALVGVSFVLRGDHLHGHHHETTEHDHEHRHDDSHHDHVHDGLAGHVVHQHRHRHVALVHTHPHVPDIHHRHDHSSAE